MDEKKKKRLIVIAVVVACVGLGGLFLLGVVAGIAVPAWMSSVRSANESAAVMTLTALSAEEGAYYREHNSYGNFDQLRQAGELDNRFAGDAPLVEGYVFRLSVTPKTNSAPPSFAANADPQRTEGFGATGRRYFYVDSTGGAIHYSEERPATADDPVLERK